jgi:hypothetical protein
MVTRHVRGRSAELDPLEGRADRLRDRPREHRLPEARRVLDEEMSPGEERGQRELDDVILPEDDLPDVVEEQLDLRLQGRDRAAGFGAFRYKPSTAGCHILGAGGLRRRAGTIEQSRPGEVSETLTLLALRTLGPPEGGTSS